MSRRRVAEGNENVATPQLSNPCPTQAAPTSPTQPSQLLLPLTASEDGDRQRRSFFRHVHRLTLASLLKLSPLILFIVFGVHRGVARYEGQKTLANAPITTLERTCTKPSYTTMSQVPPKSTPKICLTTLTDEAQQSKIQKWLRWRNFDGLLQLTWKNKQDYANQYGYYLYDESDQLDSTRPPSWSKIKATQRLLQEENCTWVWWVDADTVIMNSNKRLEEFLPSDEYDLLLSRDQGGGYNAGGWLIRNSPWSRNFLQQWWDMKSFVKPPGLAKSGDNDALKAFLADMEAQHADEFQQHVLVPPICTFNSFAYFFDEQEAERIQRQKKQNQLQTVDDWKQYPWYLSEAYFHKGDLLAHVAGYNNKESAVEMLLQLAE